MPEKRAALLVRCSKEEAKLIRGGAKLERRTVSGYILHAVLNRIGQLREIEAGARIGREGRRALLDEIFD